MFRRLFSACIICFMSLTLCSCTYFESEYESIEAYAPPAVISADEQEKITVGDIDSLRQAILTIISNGESKGKIVFDTSYAGDPTDDMSKACWQVRTQDALCAYWVENISYELSKIVTYYEARLTISYSEYFNNSGDIVYLPYSAGIESIIKDALMSGASKLVVLVDHSMYTAEDISGLVADVYRKNPVCTPAEPLSSVNMFSGSNMQRLYEIIFYYEDSERELRKMRTELSEFAPFSDIDTSTMSDRDKAKLAYEYIVSNCKVSSSSSDNTAYDALIGGKANSEGIALAFVELCHQLELDCLIVYGQHDWQEHCWNIIGIDDYFCHIDAGLTDARDEESCFLKSDESFWESYRWDMSSYPACSAKPEEPEITADEEQTESEEISLEAAPEQTPEMLTDEPLEQETDEDEQQQELLIIESAEDN